MMRSNRYQLAITAAAVAALFYIRVTQFPRSSPFELFLLLNILLAAVFRPPAALASVLSGFVASHVVMAMEGHAPRRYAAMTFVYLTLSGILVFLNHRWHSSRDRAETQRIEHDRQRERLLAQAQEANRAKDQLLANVSHELRTPLNAISGWATMISRGITRSDEDVKRAAQVIKRNADVLTKHVDELLDISMVAAGRVRLELAPIAVAPIVRSAVESTTPQAATRGVTLVADVSSDLGAIRGDAQRLEQVLLALLSNAIKFTDSGGRITVNATTRDDRTVIEITDTGIGIADDFLPFVFDRFSQEDPSTTRDYGGIGLGLAIAKHLVDLMGGEITARSKGTRHGATFTLRFPVQHAHSEFAEQM